METILVGSLECCYEIMYIVWPSDLHKYSRFKVNLTKENLIEFVRLDPYVHCKYLNSNLTSLSRGILLLTEVSRIQVAY